MNIRRGDIVWVEFRSGNGHVQRGRRPCVVVSTDRVNRYASIINVIPGTTKLERKDNPVHLTVKKNDMSGFMGKDTLFLTEQITAVDIDQVLSKTGHLKEKTISCLNDVIIRQLGLKEEIINENTK